MLQKVREELRDRFHNADISIKSPAVKVCFGEDVIEVVPANFVQGDKGVNFIYEIADGAGGWLRSSPDAHNNYVDEVDRKLSGKVKPLVRLLKAWKYYHGAPIRSFYLEIYVAQYALQKKSIIYSRDVGTLLKVLWKDRLDVLKDPLGISQYILPCSSKAQESHILSKLEFSYKRALEAIEAEKLGEIKDALDRWNLVFAKRFSSYN